MAGTDFLGVTSGTVTFAPSSTTATITLTVYGDTLYEPNEQFMVQLLAGPDFNLADGFGTVTMTNDDAAPVAPKAGMTSTSTATAPTTTTSTTTTAAASSLLVAATSDTSSPTTLAAAKSAPLTVNYPPGGGVSFTVQGANNWDFYSVRVTCGGYSTILTVVIGADGTGTTEVFYPPSGTCTATLEIPQQTNRPRVLATITFTVS